MKKIAVTMLLAVLALLGPALAPVTATAAGSVGAGLVQEGDRLYRYPASELTNADACYRREREARGIPGGSAYTAWWNSASSSARADWSRAYDRCQARHLTTGMWDWDSLVRVR